MSGPKRGFLIYGANGLTGSVTARRALRQGIRPVLGGRNADALKALGLELGLEVRATTLDDVTGIDAMLRGIKVVLNCAGPPAATVPPIVLAALRNGVHYLDVVGDCEFIFSLDRQARERGVVLCPVVGLDAAPSDLLAVRLQSLLPDATHMEVGLAVNYYSAGSTITMLELLRDRGVQVRTNGLIHRIPFGSRQLRFDAPGGPYVGVAVPLLDVYTGWRSTGIPNIAVYTASPRFNAAIGWVMRRVEGWLSNEGFFTFASNSVHKIITRMTKGEIMDKADIVFVRLRNDLGRSVEGWVQCPPGGYTASGEFALLYARHLLTHDVAGGAYAPGSLIPFSELQTISDVRISENLA